MRVLNPELESLITDMVASLVIVSDREGRVIRLNHAGTQILGYTEEDVRGKILWEVFTAPDLRERAKIRFSQILAGETLQATTVWLTRDGQPRTISFTCRGVHGPTGEIAYTVGTGIDVTTRVAAEAALNESLNRFRTMVNDAAIGIAMVDRAGKYVQVNEAFCHLTGYSERELMSTNLQNITHPDDREENLRLIGRLFRGEINSYIFEKRYLTRGGEIVWVQVSASLATATPGQPPWVIGLFEKISERHRHREAMVKANNELQLLNETLEQRVEQRTAELASSEKALREAYAALEQANVSLRKSERHYREAAETNLYLAREVEHRVRNNLAGLLALIEVTRDRAPNVKTFADAMRARIMGMRHVHTMLAQTQWTPVELEELVDSTLGALQHTAPFAADFEKIGPSVLIATQQVMPLTLVLVEWFTNSCKYGAHSVAGGRLRVSWKILADAPPLVQIRWTETGGPPAPGHIRPSLGTELVQTFIRRELHGKSELRYPATGADHLMEFTARPESPAGG